MRVDIYYKAMWFTIALVGYFLLAIVFVLDKFILTESISRPIVYTFYSTIFMLAALFAWPLGVLPLLVVDWIWAVVSGVSFGLALWSMYVAVQKSEASHVDPFIGAVITLSTYAAASLFLRESLTELQLTGVAVLSAASLLLSWEKRRGSSGVHSGYLWALLAGGLFAVSHVSAKYLYDLYPFLTGFVWTRAATGLVGLGLLFSPSVRQTFGKKTTRDREKPAVLKGRGHYRAALVAGDKALGVIAVVLIQYATAAGSVTLVNALGGVQYAFLFGIILTLTKFRPGWFFEYVTRRELALQTAAIFLIIIGSAFFVL